MSERGPNDLEETISKQKKVIEMLQYKCRKAGRVIIELNVKRRFRKRNRPIIRGKHKHSYNVWSR